MRYCFSISVFFFFVHRRFSSFISSFHLSSSSSSYHYHGFLFLPHFLHSSLLSFPFLLSFPSFPLFSIFITTPSSFYFIYFFIFFIHLPSLFTVLFFRFLFLFFLFFLPSFHHHHHFFFLFYIYFLPSIPYSSSSFSFFVRPILSSSAAWDGRRTQSLSGVREEILCAASPLGEGSTFPSPQLWIRSTPAEQNSSSPRQGESPDNVFFLSLIHVFFSHPFIIVFQTKG